MPVSSWLCVLVHSQRVSEAGPLPLSMAASLLLHGQRP